MSSLELNPLTHCILPGEVKNAYDVAYAFFERWVSEDLQCACPNFYLSRGSEADIAWLDKSNQLHEVEIKIDKSDFLNELLRKSKVNKFKHYDSVHSGAGNKKRILIEEEVVFRGERSVHRYQADYLTPNTFTWVVFGPDSWIDGHEDKIPPYAKVVFLSAEKNQRTGRWYAKWQVWKKNTGRKLFAGDHPSLDTLRAKMAVGLSYRTFGNRSAFKEDEPEYSI